jgi:hypothetical protein
MPNGSNRMRPDMLSYQNLPAVQNSDGKQRFSFWFSLNAISYKYWVIALAAYEKSTLLLSSFLFAIIFHRKSNYFYKYSLSLQTNGNAPSKHQPLRLFKTL